MRELNIMDLEVVSDGVDWGQFGAGVATVALGAFIVSNPVGLLGLGAASALSYFGGVVIGDALIEGNTFKAGTNYNDTAAPAK
ncbi:hypothetical protein D3C78_1894570 [compost metagenome]